MLVKSVRYYYVRYRDTTKRFHSERAANSWLAGRKMLEKFEEQGL